MIGAGGNRRVVSKINEIEVVVLGSAHALWLVFCSNERV